MILEEGVELTPLQFGKYLQVWKVHIFLCLYLERSHFQTGILFVLCFVSLCKTKGFFVCVCVKPKRSDFQKHTVHKLHIEHLAVSFPAPLAVLRLI